MKYTLRQLMNMGELQNTGRWELQFSTGPLSGYSEALAMRAVTVDKLPTPEYQNVEGAYHGYPVVVPGNVSYKAEITFTFVEPINMQVCKAIWDWSKQYYESSDGDVTGKSQGWDALFQDVILKPLDINDNPTLTVKCYKGLPSSFDTWELATFDDGGELAQPSFAITFNHFEYE